MRTSSEIIGTYARVLFDLANAADAVDAVDASIRSIAETVRGNVELREALADTSLPADAKRAVLGELFSGGAPEATAIAAVVIERAGVDALNGLVTRFGEIAERERNIAVAEVVTAHELSDALRSSLVEKLSAAFGRPVSLREKVDPAILGGIRISIAGRVLDGSVASQLDAVRVALSNASQGGEV